MNTEATTKPMKMDPHPVEMLSASAITQAATPITRSRRGPRLLRWKVVARAGMSVLGMTDADAPIVVSSDTLGQRLGRYALGASRDVEAVGDLAAGEQLDAAAIAVWRRRGWVVVATDAGLRLARRPRFFGRAQALKLEWRALRAISSGPQRVLMRFEGQEVSLTAVTPHHEFVRLIEAARAHIGGDRKPSVSEIRELARTKLGRLLAFGMEAALESLPDRLAPGERVERLAAASLDFHGLLVLTDRRVLLLDITLRPANERFWETPRTSIVSAEPSNDGLRLQLSDSSDLTLTALTPPERRDEFAAVLHRRRA